MSIKRSQPQQALTNLTQGTALCSDVPLFQIDSQGHWRYLNSPLPIKFARLFSSIMKRQQGKYYLITPVETVRVAVDKSALVIIDYQNHDNGDFTLHTSIGTEHRVNSIDAFVILDDSIQLEVEHGIQAELGRACYYRFVDEFIACS